MQVVSRTKVVPLLLGLFFYAHTIVAASPATEQLPTTIVPGGQTIGVTMKTSGIIVVGHREIRLADGRTVMPSKEAELKVGDQITSINGVSVLRAERVQQLTEEAGSSKQALRLTIQRGTATLERSIKPVYDKQEQRYRLGIYVKDTSAGVGTLTFYTTDQQRYGALGHVIADAESNRPVIVRDGHILRSQVVAIQKGVRGQPGEKRAELGDQAHVLGDIQSNTSFGIFGKLSKVPPSTMGQRPMPVASKQEIKLGAAQIWTVIQGEKVEPFDIEIVRLAKQAKPTTKGLIIKVTDPRLLKATGGIIQGMSGSPIIQSGKVVGAVTHVFVDDPTMGYGCYMEWMLREAMAVKVAI